MPGRPAVPARNAATRMARRTARRVLFPAAMKQIKQKTPATLFLATQTIRALGDRELRGAAGGALSGSYCLRSGQDPTFSRSC